MNHPFRGKRKIPLPGEGPKTGTQGDHSIPLRPQPGTGEEREGSTQGWKKRGAREDNHSIFGEQNASATSRERVAHS